MIFILDIYHFLIITILSFMIGFLISYFSITMHDSSNKKYTSGSFVWSIILTKDPFLAKIKEIFSMIIKIDILGLVGKISKIFEWIILRISWILLIISDIFIIKYKK